MKIEDLKEMHPLDRKKRLQEKQNKQIKTAEFANNRNLHREIE